MPSLIQIVVALIGLTILVGLYIGVPGKGPRNEIILVALIILGAITLAMKFG